MWLSQPARLGLRKVVMKTGQWGLFILSFVELKIQGSSDFFVHSLLLLDCSGVSVRVHDFLGLWGRRLYKIIGC